MKYKVLIFLFLASLVACSTSNQNKDELYKGELFFKLITIGNDIFTIEFDDGETLGHKMESVQNELELSKKQNELKDYFDLLKENDLIEKPYFYIVSQKPDIEFETVFTNENEYRKVKEFELSELREDNQKVLIEFNGHSITKGVLKCDKIKSIKLVEGITKWKK